MSLTDLQVELCSIKERIEELNKEIENMKPKSTEEEQKTLKRIKIQAESYPEIIESQKIISHSQKLLFINVLSHITLKDRENFYDRLYYLCRVSSGWKLKLNPEDIWLGGLKFNVKDIERIIDELTELRFLLLVETMVVANISGKVSSEMLSEIVELATLLKINKIEMKIISIVAKSKLTNNWNLLKDVAVTKNCTIDGVFGNIIPSVWLKKQRILCCNLLMKGFFQGNSGTISYKTTIVNAWKHHNDVVKKGDQILEIRYPVGIGKRTYVNDIIESKETGKIFIIEYTKKSKVQNRNPDYKYNKYMDVYIVSHFDNYNDFRAWLSKKDKMIEIL